MIKRLSSLIPKLRLRLSYYHSPPDCLSLEQVTVRGVRLVVPTNEDVGRLIRYFGSYEPYETNYLMRALRPDDICFDVGANIGYFTVLMANIVKQGRVHAFEPEPLSQVLLELNVRINHLENVVLNRLALGVKVGTSSFICAVDSGFSSFKDTGRRAVSNVIEVPVTTVDEYIVANGIQKVDFMKVDVEGAEGLVLDGARNLLQDPTRRPRLIMLELFEGNHEVFGDHTEEIAENLRKICYEPFVLSEKKEIPYRGDRHSQYSNVFFSSGKRASPQNNSV